MFIISADCRNKLIAHHTKRPWDEANAIVQELLAAPGLDPATAEGVRAQQKAQQQAALLAQLGMPPQPAAKPSNGQSVEPAAPTEPADAAEPAETAEA